MFKSTLSILLYLALQVAVLMFSLSMANMTQMLIVYVSGCLLSLFIANIVYIWLNYGDN